jgi:hypothetical protein
MSWEASLEYEEKVKQRKPVQLVADKEILEHERKKKIEIALLEWADATGLLDSGYALHWAIDISQLRITSIVIVRMLLSVNYLCIKLQ